MSTAWMYRMKMICLRSIQSIEYRGKGLVHGVRSVKYMFPVLAPCYIIGSNGLVFAIITS